MKKHFIFLFILLTSIYHNTFSQNGESVFRQNCAACHRIGQGRLVGPDLLNIHNIRDSVWLVDFIKSSQTMIKSGDEEAVKIFKEYNNIIMPDFNYLSDTDISSVLTYIEESTEQSLIAGEGSAPPKNIKPQESKPPMTLQERHRGTSESFDKTIILIMFIISILIAVLTLLIIKNIKGQ